MTFTAQRFTVISDSLRIGTSGSPSAYSQIIDYTDSADSTAILGIGTPETNIVSTGSGLTINGIAINRSSATQQFTSNGLPYNIINNGDQTLVQVGAPGVISKQFGLTFSGNNIISLDVINGAGTQFQSITPTTSVSAIQGIATSPFNAIVNPVTTTTRTTTTTTTVAPPPPPTPVPPINGTTTTTTVAPPINGTTTTTTVAPPINGTTTTTTAAPPPPPTPAPPINGTTTTTTAAPPPPPTPVPPINYTTTTTTVAPPPPPTPVPPINGTTTIAPSIAPPTELTPVTPPTSNNNNSSPHPGQDTRNGSAIVAGLAVAGAIILIAVIAYYIYKKLYSQRRTLPQAPSNEPEGIIEMQDNPLASRNRPGFVALDGVDEIQETQTEENWPENYDHNPRNIPHPETHDDWPEDYSHHPRRGSAGWDSSYATGSNQQSLDEPEQDIYSSAVDGTDRAPLKTISYHNYSHPFSAHDREARQYKHPSSRSHH